MRVALATLIARRFTVHGTDAQFDNQEQAIHDFDAALGSKDIGLIKTTKSMQFEMHVIQPALCRIGELWQANWVSVAQEHMATAIVQPVMTVGLLHLPPPKESGRNRVVAGQAC